MKWFTTAAVATALLMGLPTLPAATAGGAAAANTADAPAPGATAVQELLEKIRQRVKNAPVVRGRFEQLKTIQGFKQPLRSSGEFVVAKGQGIVWQVQQPFASSLIVKPDSLQSRRGDGAVSMQMQAQEEPVLRTVNAMLFAVMSADLTQLKQYFEVSGQIQQTGWMLHLVPRDAVLAQWLKEVELQGNQFVQQVVLQEARGDRSVIRIHDAVAEQVLRAQDAALFQ